MNISHVFLLFTVSMIQVWVVQAERPRAFEGSGKPGHEDTRELGWTSWTSSSKSHKSSKSWLSPTMFPTTSPTMFPTTSPTYCGKASKSWWHSSSRRLGSTWTSSSKSAKCYTGSRSSKTWWSGHSRKMRSDEDRHGERELEQHEVVGEKAEITNPDTAKVRRRRIDGNVLAQVDVAEPWTLWRNLSIVEFVCEYVWRRDERHFNMSFHAFSVAFCQQCWWDIRRLRWAWC